MPEFIGKLVPDDKPKPAAEPARDEPKKPEPPKKG
jgi:hypothetical protein